MKESFNIEAVNKGTITSVPGILASGVSCGIKKGKKDLALLYSETPTAAAGVFTRNKFKAAPVVVSLQRIGNPISAVVVNSGNANACMGEEGIRDALEMTALAAAGLGVPEESVLVASTGVIGERLPMDKVKAGIAEAASSLSPQGGSLAAEAIMTTDTTTKQTAFRARIGEKGFTVGGIAKGTGMICPNMATMLVFMATDLAVESDLLQKAIRWASDRSFNLISIDGDTSTNDTAVILANGLSGITINREGPEYDIFCRVLLKVCRELAYHLIRDAEGVTKVIALTVKGAPDFETARKISRAILKSVLVKTAVFGEDANWGRIFMAMGNSGADFEPQKTDLYLGPVMVAAGGRKADYREEEATEVLKSSEVPVTVDLNMGSEELLSWGTDLSYQYVTINSSYRS